MQLIGNARTFHGILCFSLADKLNFILRYIINIFLLLFSLFTNNATILRDLYHHISDRIKIYFFLYIRSLLKYEMNYLEVHNLNSNEMTTILSLSLLMLL